MRVCEKRGVSKTSVVFETLREKLKFLKFFSENTKVFHFFTVNIYEAKVLGGSV